MARTDSELTNPERTNSGLREQVRRRYAAAASAVAAGGTIADAVVGKSCCGTRVDASFGAALYSDDEQSELPAEALAASLGCGNPLAVADLHPGERVLDLGSGAASTCCSPHGGSARPGSPTAWT